MQDGNIKHKNKITRQGRSGMMFIKVAQGEVNRPSLSIARPVEAGEPRYADAFDFRDA